MKCKQGSNPLFLFETIIVTGEFSPEQINGALDLMRSGKIRMHTAEYWLS
jgi:hypothetical protein